MSSIFISHRNVPHDNEWAERVLAWIKDQKDVDGFLDFDIRHGLQAGGRWEDEIYAAMNRAQVVIALVSPDWLDSKWCTSEAHMAKLQGLKLIPFVITECNHPFGDIQSIRISKGEEQAFEQLRQALRTIHKLPKRPYPGLAAFQEDDAAVFFGREDETRDLINQVNSLFQGRPAKARLLLVLGASGSGKSSLLRAGLIPELKSQPHQIALEPIIPRGAPLDEIAHVLGISLSGLDAGGAADAILMSLKGIDPDYQHALISIDQAEELLRGDQGFFFEVLRTLVDRANGRVVVLATMRSDFLNEFQQSSLIGKGSNLEYETFTLDPLPEDRLNAIIAKPADRFDTTFEEGLVTKMTQDHGGLDALPLLAFFLDEFWREEYISDGVLQLAEYEKFGGMNQALQKAVDRAIADCTRLDPAYSDQQRLLRDLQEVFLGVLVSVSSISGEAVRNRVSADALSEQQTTLLTAFAKQRLIIEKAGKWEVVHEALFRQWSVLKDWISAAREDLIVVDRIQTASEQWRKAGFQETDLTHTGNRLDEAMSMLRSPRYAKRFSGVNAEYLEACAKKYHDQLAKEAELRKQAELGRARAEEQQAKAEAAKLVANKQSVRAQKGEARARWFSGIAALVALVAIGAGVFAYSKTVEARKQTARAQEQTVLAEKQTVRAQEQTVLAQEQSAFAQAKTALNLFAKRPVDGLIQAIEAADPDRVQHATAKPMHPRLQTPLVAALQLASAGRMERDALTGHSSWVKALGFHPKTTQLISSDDYGELRVWSLSGDAGKKVIREKDEYEGFTALAVSPNGAFIAVIASNRLQLLDWDGELFGAPLSGAVLDQDAEFLAVAIGPNSQNILASDDDGSIFHWNLLDPKNKPTELSYDGFGASSYLAFAPTERAQGEKTNADYIRFASGGAGFVGLWRSDTGLHCASKGHADWVSAVKYSPDGKFVISGSDDRTLRRWSVASMGGAPESDSPRCSPESIQFHGSQKQILSIDISPDGELIASAGEGGRIRLWSIHGTPIALPLEGHEGPVYQVMFSPDGKTIASASLDRTIRLWDRPSLAVAHDGEVTGMAVSADGQMIVSSGASSEVRLWNADLTALEDSKPFEKDSYDWSGPVEFVNNGKAIISHWKNSDSGQLYLSDLEGNEIGKLSNPDSLDKTNTFAVNVDGNSIISSDNGRRLVVHSLDEGAPFKTAPYGSILSFPFEALEHVEVAPKGDRIATIWDDADILILDQDGEIHPDFSDKDLRGLDYAVNDIGFSNNGRYLVVSGQDPSILVYDLESDAAPVEVGVHDDVVSQAQFFLDDQFVLSVSEDNSLRIWRLDGSMVGVPMVGHTSWVLRLAIDETNKRVFTAGVDGSLRSWDLSFVDEQPIELLARACRLLEAHSVGREKSGDARQICARLDE